MILCFMTNIVRRVLYEQLRMNLCIKERMNPHKQLQDMPRR